MRLGSFWGLTAPMLVLAFPEREDVIPFFKAMSQNSNTSCLTDLQKELVYLTRIENLVSYKTGINVFEMLGIDDRWVAGELMENPEYSNIYKSEVLQRVLVKLHERERRCRFKDLSTLQESIESVMLSWSGKLSESDKLVNTVINQLPDGNEPGVVNWMHMHDLVLESEIADSIQVDNRIRTLSQKEQRVCEYYLKRMGDIKYWINSLYSNNVKQEEVWGISFSLLAKRKPESIRYAVKNQFEQIKSMNNAKILEDTVKRVATDTIRMRENYSKFVTSKTITVTEGTSIEMSSDAEQFFNELSRKGFSMSSLLLTDREMLVSLFTRIGTLDATVLEKEFGFTCDNWNTFGEKLSELGICGINQKQRELFAEAIINTVLSVDRIYRSQEVIDRVYEILDNDVQALLDTIIPIGEVIS